MRRGVLLAGLGAALVLGPSVARADATYEMTLRTTDTLVGGTVELEQRIVVGVKGGRLRQEATGIRAVVTRLDRLVIPASPFTRAIGLPRLRAHWTRPEIVVQVAFIEWTVHGKLRHPRLLSVRFDKAPREVVRETP